MKKLLGLLSCLCSVTAMGADIRMGMDCQEYLSLQAGVPNMLLVEDFDLSYVSVATTAVKAVTNTYCSDTDLQLEEFMFRNKCLSYSFPEFDEAQFVTCTIDSKPGQFLVLKRDGDVRVTFSFWEGN